MNLTKLIESKEYTEIIPLEAYFQLQDMILASSDERPSPRHLINMDNILEEFGVYNNFYDYFVPSFKLYSKTTNPFEFETTLGASNKILAYKFLRDAFEEGKTIRCFHRLLPTYENRDLHTLHDLLDSSVLHDAKEQFLNELVSNSSKVFYSCSMLHLSVSFRSVSFRGFAIE